MSEKPSKIRASVISGLAIGAVSVIPGLNLINCCCCAGVILGGVMAFYLYKEEFQEGMPPVEASDAIMLGIIAGAVAAFSAMIMTLLLLALVGDVTASLGRSLLSSLIESLENSGGLSSQMIDLLKRAEQSMSQGRTFTGVITDFPINLVIDCLFAVLGALIGYSLFRPKKTTEQTPQPQARS